jgi:hypothetical protein
MVKRHNKREGPLGYSARLPRGYQAAGRVPIRRTRRLAFCALQDWINRAAPR